MKTCALPIFVVILLIVSTQSFSKNITVTTGTDSIAGSLREAIALAASGDVITFDQSLAVINLSEQININKSLTISGNPGLVIHDNRWINIPNEVNTTALHRLFEIYGYNSIEVNFKNLKFPKNREMVADTVSYDTNGKIILISNQSATVNFDFCYFLTGDRASSGNIHRYYSGNGSLLAFNGQNGGGIAQYGGVLNIRNCTFSNLEAGGEVYWGAGGAICQFSGELNLTNCTFYQNTVGSNFSTLKRNGSGSAIYSQGNSIISVTNCTFCEHTNSFSFTDYSTPGQIKTYTGSTHTIILYDSYLAVKNTIFYRNDGKALAGNQGSTFRSGGYNIYDLPISTGDGAAPTDMANCNPGFVLKKFCDAPNCGIGVVLSNRDFWIPVCALDAAGSAVDAIPPEGNGAPQFDQQGYSRTSFADIGACEFNGCIPNEVKANWATSDFGQDSWISDISVPNDSVVWVKDINSDSISITKNGGISWIAKPLPVPGKNAGGICALNENTAYYILSLTNQKGIYKTVNGGDTWTRQSTAFNQSTSFPDVVHFWNQNEGVAIGDADPYQNFEIYTTSNGGEQWNQVTSSNMPNGNKEATSNGQSTYRVNGNSIYFITTTARIFKSADKGKNWTVVNSPFWNTSLTNGTITFDFKDDNNGLVAFSSSDGSVKKIYRTTNGGQSWDSLTAKNYYQYIKYIPTANAYFSMNPAGGLSYSCDDGQTWTSVLWFDGIKLRLAGYSPSGKIFWGGLKSVYTPTQILSVSPASLAIAAQANSTKTFNIVSNTNWIISSNQPWLVPGAGSGSGNSTITLTAQANPATTPRTATVTVSGNGVTSKAILVTQDGKITGLNDLTKKDIEIYPNPVNQVLYFNSGTEMVLISVFDLNGKIVMNVQTGNSQINVGALPEGFYTLKIVSNSGVFIRKFVRRKN